MPTVREATYDLLRRHGMTTMFGNPGSTELPMLADFPSDFRYEPPRAEDVPHAIARAVHSATLPPKGPAFVSIPMDDWAAEVDADAVRHATARFVVGAAVAGPDAVADVVRRLEVARSPVLIAG